MGERKYFGTDGIRGRANTHPMTAEVALRVGLAAGKLFRTDDDRRHLVVIGKDTRLSGYMIEPALVAGLASVGMDVRTFGPLPTPGVAMMTRSMRADLGIMISASHNDYADNGIKLFGPDGYKLSDEIELQIEALMDGGLNDDLAPSDKLGRVKRIDDAPPRYIEIAKSAFPKRLSLKGLRVAVDCANGAGYRVAPTTLYELGAEVFPVGVEPNGLNINADCGSTHPEAVSEAVKRYRCDIGIALDGDADRVIICDEKGHDLVAVDHMAVLVADAEAVGVAVQGDADVGPVLLHRLGHGRRIGGAALGVDVQAVRLHPDGEDLGTQFIEGGRRHAVAGAVGAVDGDPQPLEAEPLGEGRLGDLDIARRGVVDALDPAQLVGGGQILIQALVHHGLDLQLDLVRQLVTVRPEQLDAVVGVVIVRGRDHDAQISAHRARHHGHARRRQGTKGADVHSHAGQTRHQGRFDHVAGQPRILADHHQMATVVVSAEQLARRQPDPQRDLRRHGMGVGAAANAVGAEIFSIAQGRRPLMAGRRRICKETFRNPFFDVTGLGFP